MSESKKLKGVIPPLISPMDERENIDEKGLRNIIRRCIRSGVSGIFLLGTMGEGQSIIKSERKRLIEIAVDEVKGRIPVLAGVSAEGTRKIMENAQDALLAGADYLVSLTPYYFEANDQGELIVFFKNIAKNISRPLVIYNSPYMTRNNITIETFRELSEDGNIAGVKDSSGDFNMHAQLIREFGKREGFSIFSGVETIMDASLIMGSDGIVPGLGTLIPAIFVDMYEKALAKDIEGVKGLQRMVLKIMDGIYLEGYRAWLSGHKYALSRLELCQEYFSMDYGKLTEDEKLKIRDTLEIFNIRA